MPIIYAIALMITCFTITTQAASQINKTLPAPLFNHLGNYHRHISTNVPLAQRYFDQGMTLFYGFEWGEAARSFRAAAKLDPNCAMCYFGIALALTYKSNEPQTGQEEQEAKIAIQKALAKATHVTQQEQAYIKALSIRYMRPSSPAKVAVAGCSMGGSEARSNKVLRPYLAALANIVKQYPQDNDAKVIYAAALFWDMVGNPSQKQATTLQMLALLKPVLAKEPTNIGANHYYIHAIEPLPHPEVALKNAQVLDKLVPDSEHLVHMPSHIYFLTGHYHEATNANLQAIAVYQQYQKTCRAQGFEPLVTYLYYHDLDFLRSSAMMEGRKQLALSAAKQLIDNLPPAWIVQNHDLQWFIPIPYFVKARFGMWQDLLQTPIPDARYQYAVGMWHYATGLAYVNTGDTKQAEKAAAALQKIIDKGPLSANLGKMGVTLLSIADNVLNAALENAHGNESATLAYLKKADKLQVSMQYHEPPDWYFPLKEAIGDVYLKWKQPKAAMTMYQDVLKQYPANGWALFGLMQSLEQLSEPVRQVQGRQDKAAKVRAQFKRAWQHADIPLPVPLFH